MLRFQEPLRIIIKYRQPNPLRQKEIKYIKSELSQLLVLNSVPFRFLIISRKIVYKLLRSSARNTAVAELPSVRLGKYLIVGKRYCRFLSCKSENDIIKFKAGGLHISYGKTEAVNKRELFLNSFAMVNVVSVFSVVLISEAFTDKMAAV